MNVIREFPALDPCQVEIVQRQQRDVAVVKTGQYALQKISDRGLAGTLGAVDAECVRLARLQLLPDPFGQRQEMLPDRRGTGAGQVMIRLEALYQVLKFAFRTQENAPQR